MGEHKTKGVFPADGAIRKLREQKGWLQKELAGKAKLDIRTLQRAERAKTPIQPGMLQSIAAQLGVSVSEISEKATPEPRKLRHENVRLTATQSADELCKFFSEDREIDYKLEADPTRQQAEKIARSLEIMASLKDCMTYDEWFDPGGRKIPLPDEIRLRGELNDLLQDLASENIRVFIGSYIFRSNYPDDRELNGHNVKLTDVFSKAKGVVVIATNETRSMIRQYYGMSEDEQIAEVRKLLLRGGRILRWPFSRAFREFRTQFEAEQGGRFPSWSEEVGDEVPF